MSFTDNLQPETAPVQLRSVARYTDLLDTKFTIPGTGVRFGADFLLGLVPGVGDAVGFGFSGLLVMSMVRHGASGAVILKMLWNVFLDSTIGAVPILGDLFDLGYKSNLRNYRLLEQHYAEGRHSGSGKGIIVGVVLALLAIFFLMLWIVFEVISWGWEALTGLF